ncbi:SEC-C metal-binding domain-containing protein [uncultured Clostridium sp.]|uniref:SEC-C metal-binding domain-containing protein n=1 Tax=uncultured Clostridium sp. TaxID=59620 RepID=UPI0028ED1EDA|nr:SEC-C metal-binding domain-containing protein [uncultured Clostridium sp.]
MSLYNEWKELVVFFVQTRGEEDFWSELNAVQEKIIPIILKNYKTIMRGALKNLAKKFDVSEISFVGFLDGINSSLKKPVNLENITENSRISLDIDFEKLYIALLEAGVDNLYNLPEWNLIFGKDKLTDLKVTYSEDKTITVPKIGRNELCPCGSEKKYKNCCGNNI